MAVTKVMARCGYNHIMVMSVLSSTVPLYVLAMVGNCMHETIHRLLSLVLKCYNGDDDISIQLVILHLLFAMALSSTV